MVKYVKNEEKVLTMVSWISRHKFCNKFHYVELKNCFQATKLCMSFEHGPIITVQREPILSMHRIYMPVVRKMSFTFYFHTKFLENVLFVLQIEFFIESANIVRPFYCSILNCVCFLIYCKWSCLLKIAIMLFTFVLINDHLSVFFALTSMNTFVICTIKTSCTVFFSFV